MRYPTLIAVSLACLASITACDQTPSTRAPDMASTSGPAADANAPDAATTVPSTPIDLEKSTLVPVNTTETSAEPWPLAADQAHAASLSAPQAGTLVGVDVQVGTYGSQADGMLTVQACQSGVCSGGEMDLASAQDNQFFTVGLENRLRLDPAKPLELTIGRKGGSKDFALWVLPAKTSTEAKVPNVGLRYEQGT